MRADPESLRRLNWKWIVDTAEEHRVLGFMAFILKENNLLFYLDEHIQEIMDSCLLRCLWNNQHKRRQFQLINTIFQANSVSVIPLKGIALTHLFYTRYPFREMGDIDILVKKSDFKKVFELMCDAGFRHPDSYLKPNRWHGKLYAEARALDEVTAIGRTPLFKDEIYLDLHITPRYRSANTYLEMDWSGIWQRSVPFPELGSNVFVLAPNDQILHLLLHTIEFHCPSLMQVMDIALALERNDFFQEGAWNRVLPGLPCSLSSRVNEFVQGVCELLNTKTNTLELSLKSSEVFEQFFSPAPNPESLPEEFDNPQESIKGVEIFKKIESWQKRLLFIAGYFLPDPDYYDDKRTPRLYLVHWWRLLSKAKRLTSAAK